MNKILIEELNNKSTKGSFNIKETESGYWLSAGTAEHHMTLLLLLWQKIKTVEHDKTDKCEYHINASASLLSLSRYDILWF